MPQATAAKKLETGASVPWQAATRPLLLVVEAAHHGTVPYDALAALAPSETPLVVLVVQPEPETVRSRGIMLETVRKQLSADADARLCAELSLLHQRGREATGEIRLASRAEAVMETARRHDCRAIVIAGPPLDGARLRWLRATGCVGRHLGARLAAEATMPVITLPSDAAP